MLTLKKVNKAIKTEFPELDIEVVTDGNHCFWYDGRTTDRWYSHECGIYTINQFEIHDFIREIHAHLANIRNH